MPLDMSDAFDPDFLQPFTVLRNTQTTNNYGEAQTTQRTLNPLGVINAASGNDLKRLGNYATAGKAISIVTQFALRGMSQFNGTQFQSDTVQWRGDNYIVILIDDYTAYGSGFIQAIASITDPVPTVPGNAP